MSAALFRLDPRGAPMIDGDTKLIAHIGYPTASFRAPSLYNPWFRRHGINAVVVPLGVRNENFREAFPQICRFTNFHGALITMPHKAAVVDWLRRVRFRARGWRLQRGAPKRRRQADRRHVRWRRLCSRRRGRRPQYRWPTRSHHRRRGRRLGDCRLMRESRGRGDCAHRYARRRRRAARRAAATELPAASSFRSARMTHRVSASRSTRRRSERIPATRCRWTPRASRRRFWSLRWSSSLR